MKHKSMIRHSILWLLVLATAFCSLGSVYASEEPRPLTEIERQFEEDERSAIASLSVTAPVDDRVTLLGYPVGLDTRPFSLKTRLQSRLTLKYAYPVSQALDDAKKKAAEISKREERGPESVDIRVEAKKFIAPLPARKPCGLTGQQGSTCGPLEWSETKTYETSGDYDVPISFDRYASNLSDQKAEKKVSEYCKSSPGDCFFSGVVDEKYPVKVSSLLTEGPATLKHSYTVTQSHTDSKTSGLTYGGKFNVSWLPAMAGPPLPGVEKYAGLEFNWSYSTTETVSDTSSRTRTDEDTHKIQEGYLGRLEGRARGAYYVGYVIVRNIPYEKIMVDRFNGATIDEPKLARYIAIPARVFVQSPGMQSRRGTPPLHFRVAKIMRPFHQTVSLGPKTGQESPQAKQEALFRDAEENVIANLSEVAPTPSLQVALGYPVGLQSDHIDRFHTRLPSGKLLDAAYPAEMALRDAQAAAQEVAQDSREDAESREMAKRFICGVQGSSACPETDIRQDSSKTNLSLTYWQGPPGYALRLSETWSLQSMCEGGPGGQKSACIFSGIVGAKYPVLDETNFAEGQKEQGTTYTVDENDTHLESNTKGWSVGGKVTAKLKKKDAAEASADIFGITYTKSTTSTDSTSTTNRDSIAVNIPEGEYGQLQIRAHAAYYTGYIVCRCVNYLGEDLPQGGKTYQKFDKYLIVPARVLIDSPMSDGKKVSAWTVKAKLVHTHDELQNLDMT